MSEQWIGPWITKKMEEDVISFKETNDNIICFDRKNMTNMSIVIISEEHVSMESITDDAKNVDFIFNELKDAFYNGSVLNYCENLPIGIGGVGDLMRAISMENPKKYIDKEAQFILPGLRQHRAAYEVKRTNNNTYLLNRFIGEDVTILAINEYELTAEAVRNGVIRFGLPTVILKSNPNGKITDNAHTAAKSMGIEIRMWGELLGDLNWKWKWK